MVRVKQNLQKTINSAILLAVVFSFAFGARYAQATGGYYSSTVTLVSAPVLNITSVVMDQGSTADQIMTITGTVTAPMFHFHSTDCWSLSQVAWTNDYDYTVDVNGVFITGPYTSYSQNWNQTSTGVSTLAPDCNNTPPATPNQYNFTLTVNVASVPAGTYSLGVVIPQLSSGVGGTPPTNLVTSSIPFTVQHNSCTITVLGYWNNRKVVVTGANYSIYPSVGSFSGGVENGAFSFTVPADNTVYQLVITDGKKNINAGSEGVWLSSPNGSSIASCNGGTTAQTIFVPYISDPQLKVQ